MHFPIITIENFDTPVEDWETDLDYEDSTLNYHTDYYGEMYSEEDRKTYIESGSLEQILDGIATVDRENEAITFLDAETIRSTIGNYFEEVLYELRKKAEEGNLCGYELRKEGYYWRDWYTMFYDMTEGYGHGETSMDFVEDAKWKAGRTVRIGNIFDAHI